MRKVTKQVTTAFMQRTKKSVGNSHTDGETLFLHGNAIARHVGDDGKAIEVSFAGWPTVTTRERLNGLPNVGAWQSKKQQFLNGKPIGSVADTECGAALTGPLTEWHRIEL